MVNEYYFSPTLGKVIKIYSFCTHYPLTLSVSHASFNTNIQRSAHPSSQELLYQKYIIALLGDSNKKEEITLYRIFIVKKFAHVQIHTILTSFALPLLLQVSFWDS